MKILFTFLFCFTVGNALYSQTKLDSLISNFERAKSDDEIYKQRSFLLRAIILEEVIHWKEPILNEITNLRLKKKDKHADQLQLGIASMLNLLGDYSSSLKLSTSILKRFEQQNDSTAIIETYNTIGQSYNFSKNYDRAISNFKKSIQYIVKKNSEDLFWAYCQTADSYAAAVMPDSGLVYSQRALKIATELKDDFLISAAYSTTGENYISNKDYDLALPFLRKAISSSDFQNSPPGLHEIYNDFAELFLGLKEYDSVVYYSQKALHKRGKIYYNDQLLRSYEYLYKSFEQTNQSDSIYKYFRLATALKDSLFDMEKIKSIESISFEQNLKDQEKVLQAQKLEEERHQNLQFALMAIGIISVIILFLLLSRSFITNTRIIKFFSVLVLLIVFEFLNLLLHPFLERITHHSPILMLLCLVCIAALLVPMHHKIEHWASIKLVEKNKKIRLAAAKKTIEQLEGNPES